MIWFQEIERKGEREREGLIDQKYMLLIKWLLDMIFFINPLSDKKNGNQVLQHQTQSEKWKVRMIQDNDDDHCILSSFTWDTMFSSSCFFFPLPMIIRSFFKRGKWDHLKFSKRKTFYDHFMQKRERKSFPIFSPKNKKRGANQTIPNLFLRYLRWKKYVHNIIIIIWSSLLLSSSFPLMSSPPFTSITLLILLILMMPHSFLHIIG